MEKPSGLVPSIAKVIVAVSIAVGCGTSSSPPATTVSPPPEADPIALVPVTDENPDPNIVEVSLEAREATKVYGTSPPTPVWTYEGSVPGPFIDAKVGDRVIIKFKNSLEPGHWMYHCHILEHAEGGMLGEVHVE